MSGHGAHPEPDGAPGASLAPSAWTTRPTPQHLRGIDDTEELAAVLRQWPSALGAGHRFALGERLGQGAQGVVFALHDHDLQRTVAVKTLHGRDIDREDIARFLHEVQITAQLEHPGVVPVHDVGILPDGTVFYTMKRVDGLVLPDWLQGRAGVRAHRYEIIQLFLKVCDTIAFAHSRGVIHRDLKPRNIMVGAYGEVLVMDWGLAKVRGRQERLRCPGRELQCSPLATHETADGTAVGTPAYMSPEQALGEIDRVDQRSDIYSLGVILYEMLSGASPYQRGDLRRTLDQVVSGRRTPLCQQPACRDLPRRLVAIVDKAMALRPEERYQQVGDLASDLRAFLAGEAVSAYREGLLERGLRWLQSRRRAVLWTLASLGAVALAAGTVWAWQAQRESRAVGELRAAMQLAASLGDWAGARQAAERILAYRPDDAEVRLQAVRFDERARLGAEMAAREAERRQRQARDRARAEELHRQAERAAARDDIAGLDEAVQLARQALALDPEHPRLAADLDRWRDRLGLRRGEAELAARAEAELRQRQASAASLAALAEERERDGDLDAAIGALQGAYELAPDPALLARLVALSARRDEQRAARERALREAEQEAARRARRAEADTAAREASQLLAAGNAESAAAAIERAAGLLPDHPELAALRARLAALLEERQRRAAEELLTQAARLGAAIDEAGQRLAATQVEIRRLRREPAAESAGSGAALAQAEDRLLELRRERAERIAECIRLLNHAHALAPQHPPVRAALAAFWVQRLREAEAAGDTAAAAAAEAQARVYDDGQLRRLIEGWAWLDNRGTEPLAVRALARGDDRLELPVGEARTVPPGARIELRRGRYVVASESGALLAVQLERGDALPVALPRPPRDLPPDCIFLPGGPVLDESGARIAEVGPFVAQAREVTCGEWLEFLNDRSTRELIDRAAEAGRGLILAPRRDPYATRSMWRRAGGIGRAGAFQLVDDSDGSPIDPRRPVSHISHDDAVAYAAWRARRDGRPWRLPTVDEWRFAVQAGDVRAYPWGSASDLLLCASAPSLARDPGIADGPGGRFASDRSLHGLLDLAGSRAEFASGASPLGPDLRPLLGGSLYDAQPERFQAWGRRDVDRRLVHPGWGLRLVYTPEPAAR